MPTILLASVSPIAIRLILRGVERAGTAAGSISALSTVGSIVGSVGAALRRGDDVTLLSGLPLLSVWLAHPPTRAP